MYRSYNEYADRLIQELSLKRKSGNEYGDVPCPNCGGKDRFYISELNGELKHHCRKDCDFIERDKALQIRGLLPDTPSKTKQTYHEKKLIPLIGAALEGDKVIIPLINLETGEDTGSQEISPSSFKKFPKGTKTKGAGAYIGEASEVLYVCEGWATSVAVHLATGMQALFALNDKGIPKAVKLLDHPNIIIAADNDGPGINAAEATGKPWVAPEKKGDDWWDVYNRDGKEGVAEGLSKPNEPLKREIDLSPVFKLNDRNNDDLRIHYDMKGIIPSVINYFAAIMLYEEWKGVLMFNEFTQTTMITKPVPTSREPKTTFKPRELKDIDFTHARRWFAKELGLYRASKNDIADAMLAAAQENSHDPVRFYLEVLKWDGVQRLNSVLINYAGADDTDFNRKVGKLWMMSAVARIFQPGCKADCAIILESRQGAGKSTFLETLAGKEWFHDGLPDLHSKDAAAGLRGKWIIKLPELSAMRRSDVEAVKAFLSRTTERFRPAYGRTEVIEPRRCVFAGTTNRSDYLADDTGGRRFWPVAVREIDISGLTRDRDQLWAEAVHCFNQPNAKWWLDASDEVEAAKLIMQRAADDPWEAAVLKYVETLPEVSTRDILDNLDIERTQQNKSNAMRVAGIITRAHWTRDGKFTAGQNRGLSRYINPNRLNLKHGEPSS